MQTFSTKLIQDLKIVSYKILHSTQIYRNKNQKQKQQQQKTHVPKKSRLFQSKHLFSLDFQEKINPNTKKSYRDYLQNTPQLPYPIYSHRKAYLSKLLWRAAGDPRLARGRSRVRAPAPACFFLHPPFLPSLGDSFFCTFPTTPVNEAIKLQTFCIQSICIFI